MPNQTQKSTKGCPFFQNEFEDISLIRMEDFPAPDPKFNPTLFQIEPDFSLNN